ncbi:MAG: hypothetical protein ACRC1P_07310 [Cellulosilyticaceae bacterium]
MKYRMITFIAALTMLFSLDIYADQTVNYNYTYDYWGQVNPSIAAFELIRQIDSNDMGEIKLSSIDDVAISDNRVFLVDSIESRINIFDEDIKLIASLKAIRDKDNKIVTDQNNNQLVLRNPEGIFIHEKEKELYIADTGAERIIVLDSENYTFKRKIERPSNMMGETTFKPSKIVVDKANRIYTIVQSGYEGIIEINEDGSFSRYFGVNKPEVNVIDYFWKRLATDDQKKKMGKVFAPAFNNLDIDEDGFIYTTTFDKAAQDKVFRLNPKGENVLQEKGYFEVMGDLKRQDVALESMFVDIAINDYGVYALLDENNGRIFIYNFDGDLLNIFGGKGDIKGNLKEPAGITWWGDQLVVVDKQIKCAYVYAPTDFGSAALEAEKQYYNGEWNAAAKSFDKALKLNGNYDIAYVGIGKNYLMKDEFEKAMYYFKLGNNREYYSKAYNGYRNIWVKDNFAYIAIVFIICIAGLIYSEYQYLKKKR